MPVTLLGAGMLVLQEARSCASGLRIPPTDTLCNRFALGECLDEIVADEAMMWTVTWSLSREFGRCRASLAPKARRLPEAGKPSVVIGAGRASFRQLSRQPEPRDDTGDQRQQTAGADRDMQAGEEGFPGLRGGFRGDARMIERFIERARHAGAE